MRFSCCDLEFNKVRRGTADRCTPHSAVSPTALPGLVCYESTPMMTEVAAYAITDVCCCACHLSMFTDRHVTVKCGERSCVTVELLSVSFCCLFLFFFLRSHG